MYGQMLTCPKCQAEMLGDQATGLPDGTILECTTCQNYFRLGDARPPQMLNAAQPGQSIGRPRRSRIGVRKRSKLPRAVVLATLLLALLSFPAIVASQMASGDPRSREEREAARAPLDAKIAAQRAVKSILKAQKTAEIELEVEQMGPRSFVAHGTVTAQNVLGVFLTQNVLVVLYRDSTGARGMQVGEIMLDKGPVLSNKQVLEKFNADTGSRAKNVQGRQSPSTNEAAFDAAVSKTLRSKLEGAPAR